MNTNKKGYIFGVSSGFLWAINTIILGFVLTKNVFHSFNSFLFLLPLTVAFCHDTFSAFILFINLKIKNKKILLNKKSLFFIIFGAIIGGPIGMASYLIASKYIGPSYSATISVLYPLLGIVMDRIFFKNLISKKQKISIFISIIALVILSFTKEDLFKYENYLLGLTFAGICVLGWASEGIIASYAMKYGEVDSELAIFLRQFSSCLFYLIIIFPIIKPLVIIKIIFESNLFFLLILASFTGSISYLFWYKAIDLLGAPIGMALNVTYVIWVVFLEIIFFSAPLSLKFIIAAILIIFSISYMSKE